jgi:hypothetical protein
LSGAVVGRGRGWGQERKSWKGRVGERMMENGKVRVVLVQERVSEWMGWIYLVANCCVILDRL